VRLCWLLGAVWWEGAVASSSLVLMGVPQGCIEYGGVEKETFLHLLLWCGEYCAVVALISCLNGAVCLEKPKPPHLWGWVRGLGPRNGAGGICQWPRGPSWWGAQVFFLRINM